jgi:phosphatidylserine/phosphatidylglycerophosphate/cardiolipin synthase-like enzyme
MDAAQCRIDMTLSFIDRRFRFPDGRTLWDRLASASDRGVAVRLLVWQNPGFMSQRKLLVGANRPPLDSRWQVIEHHSPTPAHCHHEKIWIIDAGAPSEVAFVAGVVFTRLDLVERRQAGRREGRFDAGLRVRGPVARDVAQVFEARWVVAGGVPRALHSPPEAAGEVWAQLGRTERPGLLRSDGLTTIHQQYQHAIDNAQQRIVLVNQHPGELDLLRRLEHALQRGVHVQLIVPAEPMPAIGEARRTRHPRYISTFDALGALGRYPSFEMAAPFETDEPVYVHAKLGLFDDGFLTCGSANFVDLSMAADHTETNLHVWSSNVVEAMRNGVEGLTLRPLDPRTYAL